MCLSLSSSLAGVAMEIAAPLLPDLHGKFLRLVCSQTGTHFEGLASASRWLAQHGLIDDGVRKKLQQLDVVYVYLRHVSVPLCEGLYAQIAHSCRRSSGGVVFFCRGDGITKMEVEARLGHGASTLAEAARLKHTPMAV
jgi:hypothetical protein